MMYKVVPGPKSVEGDACKLFEDLINKNSVGGGDIIQWKLLDKLQNVVAFIKKVM